MNLHTIPFLNRKLRLLIIAVLICTLSMIIFFTAKDVSRSLANSDFETFTKELFVTEVSSNSLTLHYTLSSPVTYGITDNNISFGSFETDTTDTKVTLKNYLLKLSTFPYHKLSKENQLTYDILLDYFDDHITSLSYNLYDEPLTPYTGLHSQLPILLSEYPLTSEQDIILYLELLSTLPDYFDSLLDFEIAKANAGLFMSDSRLEQVLDECTSFISMQNNYLISSFEERIANILAIAPLTLQSYKTNNKSLLKTSVFTAYESLINGLQQLKGSGTNELGLCYFDGGRAYYSDLVAHSTGSSRSVPDIKLLIQNQITTDLTDYQQASSTATLQTDTELTENNPETILHSLQEQLQYCFPPSNQVNTTIKNVPSDMEEFLSPAFYLIPPIDDISENTIYINQSQMYNPLTLYTTLAHEGYPGHLYQTTYYANQQPDPIRNLLDYGGYTEGWAIYAEMCSYYLSDLPTDVATQEQTNASIMLGLYSLTDIGIHYEGWDLFDTIDFYGSYGIHDSTAIRNIYDLILATPSNYLKYYVGYLEFLELKKECIRTWGNDFSQIRFHKTVLDIGPAPFDILTEYTIEK